MLVAVFVLQWPPTPWINFKVFIFLSKSFKSFKPDEDTSKKIELYFFKQFQHFMCFSSCFSDFGTKLDVCSLIHNNKDKHKLFFRTVVDELVGLEFSFYQS